MPISQFFKWGFAAPALIHKRITAYTFVRIVVATLLLGLATYLLVADPETATSLNKFFVLVVMSYLVMILSIIAMPRVRNLDLFVVVQLVIDAVLISVLVAMTGGLSSIFVVLYFMNIAAAAYLADGRVVVATAGLNAMLFLSILGLAVLGVVPGRIDPETVAFHILRVLGFLLVGLLTGRLAAGLKQADAALIQQKETTRALAEQYELIVKNVGSGILIADEQHMIRGANPAAESRLGPCTGKELEEVLPGIEQRGGGQELEVQGSDGPRILLCHRSPLGYQGAEAIVFEDITRLRQMEAEMEREERLVGVGRMAAAIAHEIRNPLASLSGAVQLLKEEHPGPLFDIALREIHRLDNLVTEFLENTRAPQLEMSTTSVAPLLEELVDAFKQDPRYKELVSIVYDLPSLEPVSLDQDRFKQIIWNLMLNAAQAMPDGGRIRIAAREEARGLRIDVEDQGAGIPQEELGKLFDPFYTTRRGGTGLGLVTVERFVRAHEGWVEVDSTPGRGSTFSVVFPRKATGLEGMEA